MDVLNEITYYNPKWVDTTGNIKPNSWDTSSENPTLFNVVYHFLWDRLYGLTDIQKLHLKQLLINKYETNGGEYRTNDYDTNPDSGFSLDESMALAAACYKYGWKEPLKPLRIVTWQTWFRFYDVIPFLTYCKYEWTRWLWIPQIVAAYFLPWYLWIFCIPIQVWVASSIFSSSLKAPELTSGKQLNYVQAAGIIEGKFWVRQIWRLVKKYVNYNQAFSVYYPEADHPVNIMARQIWPDNS